jgi:hypothetical protein
MATATSALQGDGVHEGIKWMKECVERNIALKPPKNGNI